MCLVGSEPGAMVPIGWVAVGDPARIHRSTPDLMRRVTRRLSEALGAHAGDAVIDG
jgi:hypothetical protein